MTVFVDTGYFVATILPGDQWQTQASEADRGDDRLVTSSLVVNETISLLQRRGLLSEALDFLRKVRSGPDLHLVYPDAAIQSEAWDLFYRWSGAGANAVDCVSFAIMKRFSIKKALTFDHHFRTAGFQILP